MLPDGAPLLIMNPPNDHEFVRRTTGLHQTARTPETLQLALREYYPNAVVRQRGLATEREAWYVYRDGRWMPPAPEGEGG